MTRVEYIQALMNDGFSAEVAEELADQKEQTEKLVKRSQFGPNSTSTSGT